MDLITKIENFNNRWNIKNNDETSFEKFKKLKIRVINILKEIDSYVPKEDIATFCNAMGIEEIWEDYMGFGYPESKNIINSLRNEMNFINFYKLIEIIFHLNISVKHPSGDKETLFKEIQNAFTYSNLNVRLIKKEKDIITIPNGEKVLDENVVNPVLSFLTGDASLHFTDALKYYEQDNEKSRIKSTNSLRRALEEFLRITLQNNKGLKANVSDLGKELKERRVNNDIKNIVSSLLNSLDQFFNENSKHKDGYLNETENEFLIYQVSLLIRYIYRILMK